MTSRIDKFLRETAGASSLATAHALRARGVTLVLSERTPVFMARSAAALALRCFDGDVTVCAAAGATIPAPLLRGLEEEASSYDMDRRVRVGADQGALRLGLACPTEGVFVDARGWTVAVNQTIDGPEPAAAAAAFAASAGVAKLFAGMIGRGQRAMAESWSGPLLDSGMPPDGPEIEVGNVVLVGAGAIGSGVGYVLRGAGYSGALRVMDPQRYDEPNHETTLVISRADALRQAKKAETLAKLIKGPRMSAVGEFSRVDRAHALLRDPPGAVVCAVDNAETRRAFDESFCGTVFNAGVGGSRDDAGHLLWSRHGEGDPPLSCLYSADEPAGNAVGEPFDAGMDECSRIAYANVSLAAPFMGLAAGALLVAGLVRHGRGEPCPTNYLKLDLLGLQHCQIRQRVRRSK